MSSRVKRSDPLPRTLEEVKKSQEGTNPPGVFVVRQDKRVTGLHVHPGGIAMLDNPDLPWRPEPAVTKAKRGIIRSRIHVRFADGSTTVIRPYKPGFKGLIQAGQVDSLGDFSPSTGDGRQSSSLDSIMGPIVVVVAVFLFPISLWFLARELFGTSARAKEADVVLTQIRAVIAPA